MYILNDEQSYKLNDCKWALITIVIATIIITLIWYFTAEPMHVIPHDNGIKHVSEYPRTSYEFPETGLFPLEYDPFDPFLLDGISYDSCRDCDCRENYQTCLLEGKDKSKCRTYLDHCDYKCQYCMM